MRNILTAVTVAALLATGASAASRDRTNPKGEAELAKLLEGRVAGKPVNCINSTDFTNTRVINGTAIVYSRTNRTLYVNRPVSGASSLNDDAILVTRQWGSQLCNIDVVNLVDRNSRIPRGFVSLGKFVPYTKPKG